MVTIYNCPSGSYNFSRPARTVSLHTGTGAGAQAVCYTVVTRVLVSEYISSTYDVTHLFPKINDKARQS